MILSGLFFSVLVAAIYWGYWMLFAKGRLHFQWGRFALLGMMVLTALTPLMSRWGLEQVLPLALPEVSISHGVSSWLPPTQVEWKWSLSRIALLGAVVQLIPFVVTLIRTRKLRKAHAAVEVEGIRVLTSGEVRTPFSFLRTVYMPPLDESATRWIVKHEMAHVRLGHTWDSVLLVALRMAAWWNPVYWLLQRELLLIQEKQADADTVKGEDTQPYIQLLFNHAVSMPFTAVTHYSQKNQILERMKSLSQTQRSSRISAALTFAFLLFMGVGSIYAQSADAVGFAEVDRAPKLSSCEEATLQCFHMGVAKHVGATLELPEGKLETEDGRFWVAFAIDTDGSVVDVELKRSSSACDEAENATYCQALEASLIECIQSLPVEEAAMKDGAFVKVEMTVPVQLRFD